MPGRKQIVGAAEKITLNANISSGVTSLASSETPTANWPTGTNPFVIVIGRGLPNEEKLLCSARSGTTFTVTTRGYDSSTAAGHTAGEKIEHVIDADTVNEANAHVNDTTRDDHTQYINNARHDITARHTFGAAFATPSAPPAIATAGAAGAAAGPARSDHTHVVGTGAINLSNMFAAGVVDATALAAAAVTAGKIGVGGVSNANQFAAGVVDSSALGSAAVIAGKIAAGGVSAANQFGAGVVDATALAANAVITAKILDANVTAAKLEALLGRGVLASGYAQVVANQTSIGDTTDIDLTSLTVTVTVRSGSRIRITARCMFTCTSGSNLIGTLAIKESATVLSQSNFTIPGAGLWDTPIAIAILTPSAGAHTYKLSVHTDAAANVMTLSAAATFPSFILVEDIGT